MSSGDIGSEEGELTEDMAGFEVKHEHYSCVVGKRIPAYGRCRGRAVGEAVGKAVGVLGDQRGSAVIQGRRSSDSEEHQHSMLGCMTPAEAAERQRRL